MFTIRVITINGTFRLWQFRPTSLRQWIEAEAASTWIHQDYPYFRRTIMSGMERDIETKSDP
jgi:hypothetical protein